MTDGEEKMIEIMPLMLDEIRGVKQEMRELTLPRLKHVGFLGYPANAVVYLPS